jgi:hypothetical protein
MRKLVIRHKFSKKDPNLERNTVYYLLNWSKTESKQLVNHYYDNLSPEDINDVLLNSQPKTADQINEKLAVQNNIDALGELLVSPSSAYMSPKAHRQILSSLGLIIRKCELESVKRQLKSNYVEPSETDIHSTLEAVNYFISRRGYSFLDFLVKLSADEKIEGLGIYNYSKLWRIMEKTGLFDKYKNEIH